MSKDYVVIHAFKDLQDVAKSFPEGRLYEVGSYYPATKRTPDEERVQELTTSKNKIGRPLIQKVESKETDAKGDE